MFVAPTPNAPTPIMANRSFRSTPPPDPKNIRIAPSSSRPATVNLRATKGKGAKAETAYLTATGLVPKRKTATSKKSSVAFDRSSLRPAPTRSPVVSEVAGVSFSTFLMVCWLSSCGLGASLLLCSFEAEQQNETFCLVISLTPRHRWLLVCEHEASSKEGPASPTTGSPSQRTGASRDPASSQRTARERRVRRGDGGGNRGARRGLQGHGIPLVAQQSGGRDGRLPLDRLLRGPLPAHGARAGGHQDPHAQARRSVQRQDREYGSCLDSRGSVRPGACRGTTFALAFGTAGRGQGDTRARHRARRA